MISCAEKIPKDFIGIIGLNPVAKNATAVELDVTAVALAALLNAKDSLLLILPEIYFKPCEYLHPSTNTNISSAAIPRIIKIVRLCKTL